jgi:hypothetical protein
VKKCREIGKKDMKLNDAMPKMSGEWGFGVSSECADVVFARRNAGWKSLRKRGLGWWSMWCLQGGRHGRHGRRQRRQTEQSPAWGEFVLTRLQSILRRMR